MGRGTCLVRPCLAGYSYGNAAQHLCRAGVPSVANSWRPNTAGAVEFQVFDWIAERVMASDPRCMDIVIMLRPDGSTEHVGADMTSDPNFLGCASFQLAQAWELLRIDQQSYECRLQLKLGPTHHPMCTGSVIVRIIVEAEPYNAGVRYRQ
jgi:hypothetical protein